ncbi:MAG TPA: peptide deformylase [Thermomicrobiales bacterium]
MTIRGILPLDHPLVKEQAKKVHRFDRSLQALVADLFETMHAADGAGLAAPQIGLSIRVFVASYNGQDVALFNPEITKAGGMALGAEGCLSLPGFVGEHLPRAAMIQVRGKDQHGRPVKLQAEGYFARVLQHEIDHLDGILFTDRLRHPDDLRPLTPEELAAATVNRVGD